MSEYADWFRRVTGFAPLGWQAEQAWSGEGGRDDS
jgi:hypothetical protein